MAKRSRRKFGAEFKTKVVLEALKERSTVEELARKYELHPTQINTWKKEAVANMSSVFGADKGDDAADPIRFSTDHIFCTPLLHQIKLRLYLIHDKTGADQPAGSLF